MIGWGRVVFHKPIQLLIVLCFALVAIAPARAEAPLANAVEVSVEAAPALWKIEKAKGAVWLFGTIHLLPDNSPWAKSHIMTAFQSADHLVLEAPIDTVDPAAMVSLLQKYGFYPAGKTLWDVLTPQTSAKLKATGLVIGVPEIAFQQMKPWMAYTVLTERGSSQTGFAAENGVDMVLGKTARARAQDVLYFETIEEQLQMFSSLPEPVQTKMLSLTLDQFETMGASLIQLYDTWLKGDETLLDGLIRQGFTEAPEFFTVLFDERNKAWVQRIDSMLADEESYFIAVGAGHLIGPGSVVDLLRSQGHVVERQ